MKASLCPSCETYIELLCESERETYNVRGEPVEIEAEVAICPKCGLKVFDEERDSRNLELAYNEYRKKHGLLLPSEIRLIRERYGLSQRALSRLLGWGEITLHRYESGALQDRGHNNMLRILGEPKNMRTLLEADFANISRAQRKILEERIDHLTANEERPPFHVSLEHRVSHEYMDSSSGYKEYDLDKFKNAILYLAHRLGGVLKTKLNKLLFYVDFLNFKETSVSITGSRYVHLPYGPVPDNYQLIVAEIIQEGDLELNEVLFDTERGIVGEILTASTEPDRNIFSGKEIYVMDFVSDIFRALGSGQIANRSHQEAAYRETKNGEYISYEYAKELSLVLPVSD